MQSSNKTNAHQCNNEKTDTLRLLINEKRFDPYAAVDCVLQGANPNLLNDDGDSLFHLLVQGFSGNSNLIIKLLGRRATDLFIKNKNGKMPFDALLDGDYGKAKRGNEDDLINKAAEIYMKRGLSLGGKKEAFVYFNMAIRLAPKNSNYYFNLGAEYHDQKDLEKVKEVCRIWPGELNEKYYFLLGAVALREKDYDTAMKNFNIAKDKPPGSQRNLIYQKIGEAHLLINNSHDAIAAFKEALKIDENEFGRSKYNNAMHYWLARAYLLQGDLVSVIKSYRTVLKADHNFQFEDKDIQKFCNSDLSSLSQTLLLDFIGEFPDLRQLQLLSQCKNPETMLGKCMHAAASFSFFGSTDIMDRIDKMIEDVSDRMTANIHNTFAHISDNSSNINIKEESWTLDEDDIQLQKITRKGPK